MRRAIGMCLALLVLLSACGESPTASAEKWQEQYDLGVRYLEEGNYEEAIIAFSAAIEIDPKRAEAYVGRGDTHIGLVNHGNAVDSREEHYTSAINDYLHSLELDDQQAEVYLKAADIYLSLENEEDALSILERGYEVTGDATLLERIHRVKEIEEKPDALYDNDILTVSGTLVEQDYEINSMNKGTVYILELDSPITRSLYSDGLGYSGEIVEINEIQIGFLYQDDYIRNNLLNNHIEVTGSVMYAHTGHHLTTVLLMDASVSENQ